jgi:hypothetical protein
MATASIAVIQCRGREGGLHSESAPAAEPVSGSATCSSVGATSGSQVLGFAGSPHLRGRTPPTTAFGNPHNGQKVPIVPAEVENHHRHFHESATAPPRRAAARAKWRIPGHHAGRSAVGRWAFLPSGRAGAGGRVGCQVGKPGQVSLAIPAPDRNVRKQQGICHRNIGSESRPARAVCVGGVVWN